MWMSGWNEARMKGAQNHKGFVMEPSQRIHDRSRPSLGTNTPYSLGWKSHKLSKGAPK